MQAYEPERMSFQEMQVSMLKDSPSSIDSVVETLQQASVAPSRFDISGYIDERFYDLRFMVFRIAKRCLQSWFVK